MRDAVRAARGKQRLGSALVAAAAFAAAGCVTTYEDAPLFEDVTAPAVPAVALTIPFGAGGEVEAGLLTDFYGGVCQRLQSAAEDRDPAQIEALLAAYERPGLPSQLQEVLRGYRAMAVGLRFQRHAVEHAKLTLVPAPGAAAAADVPPLGAAFTYQLILPPPPAAVRLGGGDDEDACGFAVAVTLHDTFVDGSTRSTETQDFVWLPAAFGFEHGQALVVPIGVDVAAADVVRRALQLRVLLMPGYVQIAGERVPVQRTAIAERNLTQWPAGWQAIAAAPLATLREALRRGDADHFAHVFVAASFVGDDEREPATTLLIEQVRFGRQDQALVAMAALQVLTGAPVPAGDRDAWLAWWQARR